MVNSRAPAETVDALLRARADRGVFRTFAASRVRGKLDCSAVWLGDRPLRIVFDPQRGVLEFRDLLPNLPYKSGLYRDFRKFLKGRAAEDLPGHRRVDPDRVRLRGRNRKGSVTVSLESLDGDWEYCVSKGLKLVNEVFLGFLRGPYHEYMVSNFHEPED